MKTHFLLQPQNPKGVGSIEHYFHFVLDLVLPLFKQLHGDQIPRDAVLHIERCGIFVDLLERLFSRDIHVIEDAREYDYLEPLPLIGFDTSVVSPRYGDIEALRQHVLKRFAIPRRERKHVVLIERSAPAPYFTSEECEYPGSGTTRRMIRNHDQLRARLEEEFGSELLNVRLEEVTFEEQVDHFYNARTVIGQHGAGLVNCLWMEPGSSVFELTHTGFAHFLNLSIACRLDHYFFPMFGPKSKLNVPLFLKFMAHRLRGLDGSHSDRNR